MDTTSKIAVTVQHRETLLALGIEATLNRHPDIQVQRDSPMQLRPSVVITDYESAMSWIKAQAAPRLARQLRLLIVASHGRGWDVRNAVHAGVLGYVLQESAADELPDAVRQLARGLPYLSAAAATSAALSLSHASLTRREIEVLAHLASGAPNKTIATTMDISVGTVKSHVQNILAKLGAATRTEAVSEGVRLGLVGEVVAPARTPVRALRAATPTVAHAGLAVMQ